MIVREIEMKDAKGFGELLTQVDASSDYMLWEVGERNTGLEKSQTMIQQITAQLNSTILIAEQDEVLGYLLAIGGSANRNKHTAYIVIGIAEKARGQGIGTRLFQEIEKWAYTEGIHRLELTVATENKAGLVLYEKMGFEIEGTKKDSLCIQGKFIDEYYMAKIIE